ncbi:MAG TPA: 3-phosphoshikimate 1-carboxyvinyltransferase [Streptosporangiaceae bacterium]|jgi:3-phosphoshikimate 1-carboxyvinyltransferase
MGSAPEPGGIPAPSQRADSRVSGDRASEGWASEGWATPTASRPVHAWLALPGSKSVTNRALILAALGSEPTRISGPLHARDTELMAAAIAALGATVTGERGDWVVTPGWRHGAATVDVGNAGTVIRFMPPVAALARGDVRFQGDPRAAERPVGAVLGALRQLGARIEDDGRAAIPFTVRGQGQVPGGTVGIDASGSSQFVSGLLLAAARYDKGAEIRHAGPRIPSAPHIAMTVAMLRAAGADVETGTLTGSHSVADIWRVHPGELAPPPLRVEPDLSNAAPFLAAALVTGGEVTISGWPERPLQAAGQILETMAAMGGAGAPAPGGMRLVGSGRIRGITADLRDVPELTPVLVALAALADSPSTFTGISHLRTQESDRLAALASEIGGLGGDVTELDDGLHIRPRPLHAGTFDSYDDHRLVMAAAVLGLAVPGLRVRDSATVGKTFPGFEAYWQRMLEQAGPRAEPLAASAPEPGP